MEDGRRAAPQAAAAGETGADRALQALRRDWGHLFGIGRDGGHGWRAAPVSGDWALVTARSPDGLRTAMAADRSTRAARLWCTRCGKQLTASGDRPEAVKIVHAAGGERGAPDGHLPVPAAREPELHRAAREIGASYRGVFTVTACLGMLRADWAPGTYRAGGTPVHYTAADGQELRRILRQVTAGTRWERPADGPGR